MMHSLLGPTALTPSGRVFGRRDRDHARARAFDTLLAAVERAGLRDALEIGCERGALAAHLCAEYNLRVVGVDRDVEAVAEAGSRFANVPDLRFETLFSERLNAPAQSFDLVVVHASALARGIDAGLMDELTRVVRPGGLVVFEHTSVHPWVSWLRRGTFAALTPDRLRTEFADRGLYQRGYPRRRMGFRQHHMLVLQKMAHWMQPTAAVRTAT